MEAAALGGVHGLDGWLETLKGLIAAEPVPAWTAADALVAPLNFCGVTLNSFLWLSPAA